MQIETEKVADILPAAYRNIVPKSRVYGGQNKAYLLLEMDYYLKMVNYSDGEYVKGNAHTNSIESLWALVKCVSTGIHHGI